MPRTWERDQRLVLPLKVQPQGLAHSMLRSSEMGCSATRALEEGCMFVGRDLKYMGERPHCITSIK